MVEKDKNHSKNEKYIDMISGSISGASTRMVVAPLDVVKIRFQLQKTLNQNTSTATAASIQQQKPIQQYKGVINTLFRITREEGIRALWKGNLSAEFLWVSYATAQFSIYNSFVRQLDRENYDAHHSSSADQHYKPPTSVALLAGAGAGSIATAISYPFDTIRTNLIAQHSHTKMSSCIRQLHHEKGITGFYKGLTSSILQIIPQIALQFATYEWLKNIYIHVALQVVEKEEKTKYHQQHHHNQHQYRKSPKELAKDPFIQLMSGASSGAISKFIVLPFDVVKKRMQVSTSSTTLKQCIVDMFRNEGWRSFYKGGVPSIIKAGAAASLSFTCYEQAKLLITDFIYKVV